MLSVLYSEPWFYYNMYVSLNYTSKNTFTIVVKDNGIHIHSYIVEK
jgi:hypothetical protein